MPKFKSIEPRNWKTTISSPWGLSLMKKRVRQSCQYKQHLLPRSVTFGWPTSVSLNCHMTNYLTRWISPRIHVASKNVPLVENPLISLTLQVEWTCLSQLLQVVTHFNMC